MQFIRFYKCYISYNKSNILIISMLTIFYNLVDNVRNLETSLKAGLQIARMHRIASCGLTFTDKKQRIRADCKLALRYKDYQGMLL